jgi:phosphoglycolate phosphatase
MKIKAIIFDYDDTLVLTFRTYVQRDLEVCSKLKIIEPPLFSYQQVWGLPWRIMLSRLHPDVDPDEFMQMYEQMHSSATTHSILGMKDVFATLFGKHYVLGIVSAKPTKSLQQRVLYFDIKKYLLFELGAEDTHHHKPDPRAFLEALEKLRPYYMNPSEVLYVGDLIIDATSAKGAGLSFVGVLTGITTKREFLDAGVREENILESIRDLPQWLQKYSD